MGRAGPAAVTTQICLSLAAFAVQCEAWQDAVAVVIASFAQSVQEVGCALRVLQLLPEESTNPSLDVTQSRRDEFRSQLQARFREVVGFLCQCSQQWDAAGDVPASAHARIVQCFDSWLTVVPHDVPMAGCWQPADPSGGRPAAANPSTADVARACRCSPGWGTPRSSTRARTPRAPGLPVRSP